MSSKLILSGERRWHVEAADCLDWLAALPADCADLCFFSPPYEAARSYGIDFNLKGQAWVDWMVKVFTACQRVCRGLVACVCEGQTRGYRWSAAPALLMADLHRAGLHLRKPPAYHRVGIPGSGGPDWLRNDYEFVVCTARPGKLPWSDNTACGHPPRWAPGVEMSHRVSDGTRVNQWGGSANGGNQRKRDGRRQPVGRPSHRKGHAPNGTVNGDVVNGKHYTPPETVNPGNVIEAPQDRKAKGEARRKAVEEGRGHKIRRIDSGEYADKETEYEWNYVPPAIANPGNVIDCNVGGGQMGSPLSHDNEAPFPEALARFFVLSFCPPGGVVLDCFSGSGTTGAVAVREGRRFLGCDIRPSQVDLSARRISGETPNLFAEAT